MGMTEEQIRKLEDLCNETERLLVASEDHNEERIHYKGKRLGIFLALDILGYVPKEDGPEEVYLQKGVVPIKYPHYKIVKKEE